MRGLGRTYNLGWANAHCELDVLAPPLHRSSWGFWGGADADNLHASPFTYRTEGESAAWRGEQLNDISSQLDDVTMGIVTHGDALDEPT